MSRRLLLCLVLLATSIAAARSLVLTDSTNGNGAARADVKSSSLTLEQLCSGGARIVDLTYALNDKTPYWPGDDYEPFRLRTIATLEKNGVLSKAFSCPEHLGTHLDAPNHFEPRDRTAHLR